jgi:hypothetical protein
VLGWLVVAAVVRVVSLTSWSVTVRRRTVGAAIACSRVAVLAAGLWALVSP